MKQQEFLFELIKTLSKSEKRYFKLLAHRSAGSKSYLELFESIERQKNYQEEKIRQRFKLPKRNFAVAKNYLQEQILKSLRNFHGDMSIKSRIHALLVNVEILFNKGLIEQCTKELKKARSLAMRHEKFGLLQEILNWERQFGSVSGNPTKTEAQIGEEEDFILTKQRNVLRLQSLHHQLLEFKRKTGYIRGDEDKKIISSIIDNPLLKDVDQALSERARYHFHCAWYNYHYLNGDFNDLYRHSEEILALDHSSIDEYEYLNGMLNHIPAAFFVNRNREALHHIDLVSKIQEKLTIGKFEHIDMQIFYYGSNYKIAAFVKTGNFDELHNTLTETEEKFVIYERNLSPERIAIMTEILALTYFLMGRPNKTRYWANRLLSSSRKHIRLDVYVSIRVLHLLALVELQDYQTLGYSANSAYRSLKMLDKSNGMYEIELEIVRALKKVPGLINHHDFKHWAQKLEMRVNKLVNRKSYHDTIEYDYILKWLKSKIEGSDLTDVMKANASALEPYVGGIDV